jgi:host factor-I protein
MTESLRRGLTFPLAPVAAAHNFDIVQSTVAACHATGSKLGLLEYINAIIVITTTKTRITAVANEKSQNVQDVFLNHVRKSKTPVTVFLVNGVKLQGVITWFDNFSVLLRRDGHTQLVYKHAISTVMPGAPIMLFDQSKAETPAPVEATGTLKLHRAPEPQYDPDMEG